MLDERSQKVKQQSFTPFFKCQRSPATVFVLNTAAAYVSPMLRVFLHGGKPRAARDVSPQTDVNTGFRW